MTSNNNKLLPVVFFTLLTFTFANRTPYSDIYCHTFANQGMTCDQCSTRYYLNPITQYCNAVSNDCKTWDTATGRCTSCYQGWGSPINGVCYIQGSGSNGDSPTSGSVKNCNNYGFRTNAGIICNKYQNGCFKVCLGCELGWILSGGICVPDPNNCMSHDASGKCISCIIKTVMVADICIKVSDDCNTWSTTTAACTSCFVGYSLSAGECHLSG